MWDFTEQAQFAGGGRGGLGYHLAGAVGAALAHKGSDRLCVGIVGDGEFLMPSNALWTAARYRIPLLLIVFNNRSYYNDEGHQEYVAAVRCRPMENKGVGIQITDPDPDFAALARSLGVAGFGPVADPEALGPALDRAIRVVREDGLPAVVDVITQPR